MHKFEGRRSMTKNWPGGRRKATVIVTAANTLGEGSVPDWNRQIADFKRPYWPPASEVEGLGPVTPELAAEAVKNMNPRIEVSHGAAPGTVAVIG